MRGGGEGEGVEEGEEGRGMEERGWAGTQKTVQDVERDRSLHMFATYVHHACVGKVCMYYCLCLYACVCTAVCLCVCVCRWAETIDFHFGILDQYFKKSSSMLDDVLRFEKSIITQEEQIK